MQPKYFKTDIKSDMTTYPHTVDMSDLDYDNIIKVRCYLKSVNIPFMSCGKIFVFKTEEDALTCILKL